MSNITDTSDLHDRLAELEAADYDQLTDDEAAELAELEAMRDGIEDWQYGETLIPDGEFTDYARELAADVGDFDPSSRWPYNHIDWQAAADDLRQDYTEYTYLGTTYLAR